MCRARVCHALTVTHSLSVSRATVQPASDSQSVSQSESWCCPSLRWHSLTHSLSGTHLLTVCGWLAGGEEAAKQLSVTIRSFVRSFVRSFGRSHTITHSLTHSLTHYPPSLSVHSHSPNKQTNERTIKQTIERTNELHSVRSFVRLLLYCFAGLFATALVRSFGSPLLHRTLSACLIVAAAATVAVVVDVCCCCCMLLCLSLFATSAPTKGGICGRTVAL